MYGNLFVQKEEKIHIEICMKIAKKTHTKMQCKIRKNKANVFGN